MPRTPHLKRPQPPHRQKAMTRPNVYLVMIAVKPGTKPPARTVRCDQCVSWLGGKGAGFGFCGQLMNQQPADFGCAYFQRRPEQR